MNKAIQIRDMTLQDIPAVMEIEREAFDQPWSRKAMEEELANPIACYLVLVIEGKVAAYAGMWKIFEEGHITNVAVGREYQGQGLGKALGEYLLQRSRELEVSSMTLEVRRDNAPAIGLYTKLGFEPCGLRKDFYGKGADAIIMWNMNI